MMITSAPATLTSKGQVTIPKQIREQLGLEACTEVEFVLAENGSLTPRPKEPPMEQLRTVQTQLAARDIDIDQMRKESKQVLSSYLTEGMS